MRIKLYKFIEFFKCDNEGEKNTRRGLNYIGFFKLFLSASQIRADKNKHKDIYIYIYGFLQEATHEAFFSYKLAKRHLHKGCLFAKPYIYIYR